MEEAQAPVSATIKLLLLTKNRGYRHECIPSFISTFKSLPFTVHATEDSEALLSLSEYHVVALGHNTGPYLTSSEVGALREFVEAGGGVVGVHAATSGMAADSQYGGILGEVFDGHPDPQWGEIVIENPNHYINGHTNLPEPSSAPASAPKSPYVSSSEQGLCFPWFDEYYTFKHHPRESDGRTILLSAKHSSFKGKEYIEYPLAWCHNVGTGRVYYTALGHFDEAYEDQWFMEALHRGVLWVSKRDQDHS
ncbi:ThuA-like domain-containing protein [Thelonectria olida]|uniref:ThuA-like domain-containing protein n=1 Tax=Thelonectria olida TaxID=1576542 RepID=A0A9P8WFU9_9HYPO|nr:ThuA-like domain-containing protein [Thelonectria olida]